MKLTAIVCIAIIKTITILMIAMAFVISIIEMRTLPKKKYLAKITAVLYILLLALISMSTEVRDILACVMSLTLHAVLIYALGIKSKTTNNNAKDVDDTTEIIESYSVIMLIANSSIAVLLGMLTVFQSIVK
jgi:hypothetical protein